MFRTFIGLTTDEQSVALLKVVADIKAKDSTFNYEIKHSKLPQYKWLLIVYSPTQDVAHKRGMWIVTRTGFTRCKNSGKQCTRDCKVYSRKCTRLEYLLHYWIKEQKDTCYAKKANS